MRAFLLPHTVSLVCGGLQKMPQTRGAGFENRNCQIPTFAPSVPALGGVGETIDRCIMITAKGYLLAS